MVTVTKQLLVSSISFISKTHAVSHAMSLSPNSSSNGSGRNGVDTSPVRRWRLSLIIRPFGQPQFGSREPDLNLPTSPYFTTVTGNCYEYFFAKRGMARMKDHQAGIERFNTFSDAVFAVLITILVLDLKPPPSPAFSALVSRWPSWLSYVVSYWFVAIVWVNHHHSSRCAEIATPGMIWINFAHLFATSLLPFSTAWIADSRLAPFPVALYAAVFVLVNATDIALRYAVVRQLRGTDHQMRMALRIKVRAFFTLGIFLLAMILSLKWPLIGMGLICFCLLLYVLPDVPGIKPKEESPS
jgi:uncharacterized membrane protein